MRASIKLCLASGFIFSAIAFADLAGSFILPLDDDVTPYSKTAADDPVERLNRRIAQGEVKLDYDAVFGYLPSVLRALNVPKESQMLVFSKTSFQAPKISPREPRALYFNDTTSVGFVRSGDVLEFASVDPKLGPVFYTLNQEQAAHPHFDRRDGACLQCHDKGATLGVPGLLMRSVYPDATGMPIFQAGDFFIDHRSPLAERWGGWYVTGAARQNNFMGNAVALDPNHPDKLDGAVGSDSDDPERKLDSSAYLTPNSDAVALMVMAHQAHMTNLITRVSYEVLRALDLQDRFNRAFHESLDRMSDSTRHRIDSAVEEMVRYMLFVDEAKLDAPIRGSSGFAEVFPKAGPRDRNGRSLRDLDLEKHLFRYPLSYMIYTEAFDRMPEAARDRIYRRLFDILSGKDNSTAYAGLASPDRQAILEILLDTKKNLPAYWKRS